MHANSSAVCRGFSSSTDFITSLISMTTAGGAVAMNTRICSCDIAANVCISPSAMAVMARVGPRATSSLWYAHRTS